jgi:hypothetical protein
MTDNFRKLARERRDADAATRRAQEFEDLQAFLRDPASSPFAHLSWKPDETTAAAVARRIVDAAALARSGGPAPAASTGVAKQILAAAAVRDAGGHAKPKPKAGSLAAQIILAGKKRRGEI